MKHKSPKKRRRQDEKRNLRNVSFKHEIASQTKKVLQLVEEGDKEKALEALKEAQAKMDSGVTKGILKRNTAGRRVARIMRRVTAMA